MGYEIRQLIYLIVIIFPLSGHCTSIKTNPEIPQIAIDECLSGEVEVQFIVDELGRPQEIEIINSKPDGVFDEVTVNNFKKFIFDSSTLAAFKKFNGKYSYTLTYDTKTYCNKINR